MTLASSRPLFVVALLAQAGCLFIPNVEQHGYITCAADGDCEPGRYCGEGLCAPPPWHDEEYADRRILVVENTDVAPMPAGTAVPVLIGGETGVLQVADVAADLRFADFDRASNTWKVVPVHLDREDDRFTAWIPTQREIAQGKSDVLAWIESQTVDGLPSIVEDPEATFDTFDTFDAASEAGALDDTVWKHIGTGDPGFDPGLVNIRDNQALILRDELVPPVSVTLLARVNGSTCEDVFMGLVGDDNALTTVPPAAGFFVDADLQGNVLLAPRAEDVPTPVATFTTDTALRRYTVAVDTNAVRLTIDGEVVHEDLDLRPPFEGDPLHLTVQVGGACSVDLETAWVTPLPLPEPVVTPGPLVELGFFN